MKTLLLLILPLIYIQEKCTPEELKLLQPHYEKTQRQVTIFTPFQTLTIDNCEINKEQIKNNRFYFSLVLNEFNGEKCELRYALKYQKPYKKNHPLFFEYTFSFIKQLDHEHLYSLGDRSCGVRSANEKEDQIYQRLKWHYEVAEEHLHERLVRNLERQGHLVLAAHLLEEENKLNMQNKINNEESHTTKLLMKHLEAEVSLHFKHTYERHRNLAARLAVEHKEEFELKLKTCFIRNKEQIKGVLTTLNTKYLVPLEKKIIETAAHSTATFLNNKFPMVKAIYPNFEEDMKALIYEIVASPQVITMALNILEEYTPKIAYYYTNKLLYMLSVMKNSLVDRLSRRHECGTVPNLLYNSRNKYLYLDYQPYFEIGDPKISCTYLNHHINGYSFKKITFVLSYQDIECQINIEMSDKEVFLAAEPYINLHIRKCDDIILSDYTNVAGLMTIITDPYLFLAISNRIAII